MLGCRCPNPKEKSWVVVDDIKERLWNAFVMEGNGTCEIWHERKGAYTCVWFFYHLLSYPLIIQQRFPPRDTTAVLLLQGEVALLTTSRPLWIP